MENVDLEGIACMWNEMFTWSKEQLKRFGKPYERLKELADPKYPKSVRKPELETRQEENSYLYPPGESPPVQLLDRSESDLRKCS